MESRCVIFLHAIYTEIDPSDKKERNTQAHAYVPNMHSSNNNNGIFVFSYLQLYMPHRRIQMEMQMKTAALRSPTAKS